MWNKIKARRHGKDEALVSERPKKNKKNKKNESQLHEEAINAKKGSITDSKEVWFAGCHCGALDWLYHLRIITNHSCYRRRRRLSEKRHTVQSSKNPVTLDDS